MADCGGGFSRALVSDWKHASDAPGEFLKADGWTPLLVSDAGGLGFTQMCIATEFAGDVEAAVPRATPKSLPSENLRLVLCYPGHPPGRLCRG